MAEDDPAQQDPDDEVAEVAGQEDWLATAREERAEGDPEPTTVVDDDAEADEAP